MFDLSLVSRLPSFLVWDAARKQGRIGAWGQVNKQTE